jgi:predicted kinase
MPRLIVLVGLPASGKSTWRANFLNSLDSIDDWCVISSDDIIEEECAKVGCTYSEGFERFAGYAQGVMRRRARRAANQGKNVIWDQTNMTPKARKSKIRTFPDYTAEAVVFSVPDTVLNERLKSRPGKEIPKHVIDGMARSYVAPSKDEGFTKISYVRD